MKYSSSVYMYSDNNLIKFIAWKAEKGYACYINISQTIQYDIYFTLQNQGTWPYYRL